MQKLEKGQLVGVKNPLDSNWILGHFEGFERDSFGHQYVTIKESKIGYAEHILLDHSLIHQYRRDLVEPDDLVFSMQDIGSEGIVLYKYMEHAYSWYIGRLTSYQRNTNPDFTGQWTAFVDSDYDRPLTHILPIELLSMVKEQYIFLHPEELQDVGIMRALQPYLNEDFHRIFVVCHGKNILFNDYTGALDRDD